MEQQAMAVSLSRKNANHMSRWDLQAKIENILMTMDTKYEGKLHTLHLEFTDPNGIHNDYILEILDDPSEGSLRDNY